MAEGMHIPMENAPNPACGRWEALLADALDGLLAPAEEAAFQEHMAVCPACAALYAEARRGQEWLEFLAPEPETPAGLLDRILAQTGLGTGAEHHAAQTIFAGAGTGTAAAQPWIPQAIPALEQPGFMGSGFMGSGFMGFVRQQPEPRPGVRLMMTAAMAFFSIALTLSLTGVQLSQIRFANLRPSQVRSLLERRLTMASVPIIRYYDHLRVLDEVQSRMQEIWGEEEEPPEQSAPRQAAPGESRKQDGGPRIGRPHSGNRGPAGEPAQAAVYYGNYVDTSFAVRGVASGIGPAIVPGIRQQENMGSRLRFRFRLRLTARAFGPRQPHAAGKAAGRNRLWTA